MFHDWGDVSSSNIEKIKYDPDRKVLHVKFKSGKVYAYFNVYEHEFNELMMAPSKGRFIRYLGNRKRYQVMK